MIVLISTVLGVVLGVTGAKRRNGNRLDLLQYGAGYGIAFAILGVFATLIVERLAA